MGFQDWVRDTIKRTKHEGLVGVQDSIYRLYVSILRRFEIIYNPGTAIYDYDWDLLIVLDGTRTDAMSEIATEHDFLKNPNTIYSLASSSKEWHTRNFTDGYPGEISNTVLITGNTHSKEIDCHLRQKFLGLEEVWKYAWDNESKTIPPDKITDAAIKLGREYREDRDRMIVHYMQPHFPSIPQPVGKPIIKYDGRTETSWHKLRRNEVSREEVWESYIANLRYVMGFVTTLLDNVDAEKVVITSDHGNAIGEWGVYSHPNKVPLKCLREVPWWTTQATDSRTRIPGLVSNEASEQISTEDQLKALGYKS